MLLDFLYTHPTWLVGLVVIGVWTGLSLAGLYIFHRLVDLSNRAFEPADAAPAGSAHEEKTS